MHHRIVLVLLALLLGTALPGRGQVASRPTLTLDGAKRVIDAAVDAARSAGATGVIAVVDDGGNLMAVERLDGTFPAGANISIGKARTAALFRRPTNAFEEIIRGGRTPMIALPDFTPLQGGVPLVVDGQVVGGVGVSGAASAQQDEELALAGAQALSAEHASSGAASSSAVTHIGHADVAAAFTEGAVLVNNGRYMVHASHRDRSGMAEIHTLDTDIIYVLQGTATFVTGGNVIDPKTTESNELRGPSIENGTERRLAQGDVVVVPNGVPHWFREVTAPFDYYVVKVR